MSVKSVSINEKYFNSISEAAKFYNITYASLAYRIRKGMTPEEAVALPVKKLKMGPLKIKEKTYKNFSVAAKAFN